jgi:Putative homoserine kinase type II (protein kinase fold)
MNLEELRQAWPIPEPWSLSPLTSGINNLTQVLETSTGSYILRTYRRDRSLEKIRYELRILRVLQQKNLTFQIPAPIPTATGELFAALSGTIVTISPHLSGSIPQNDNLEQAHAAGQALAELVTTLAEIRVEPTSQIAPFPLSNDFAGWAGCPVKPAEVIEKLPLAEKEQNQILRLLENTQAFAPFLYQTLPQQVIHRDYDPSNILMEGNVVTGVLDFEFCGPDVRILDLAYALSQWPFGLWNTGREWSVIDAFGKGYFERQRLTLTELEMLPHVLRLRATTSLFFRLGRYQQGVETSETLLEHIQYTLRNEIWLEANKEELLSHIDSWYH